MSTLITGGTVYLDDGPAQVDVLIEGEHIVAIGHGLQTPHAEVLPANGLAVLPGMIDFHVHMDDLIGGVPLADSYRTGSQAATLTGITTLIGFVTQSAEHSLSQDVHIASDKVNNQSFCDVGFHLTPTRFAEHDWGDIEDLIARGFRTFKFYTTYKRAGLYQSYESLRTLFARLSTLNVRILVHCEDEDILQRAEAFITNFSSAISHARRRPPEAEVTAIEKIIALAEATNAKAHIVHVSTAEGTRTIQRAAVKGGVTCETAPHYLLLNDDLLAAPNGHRWICSPPLRSEMNRAHMEDLAAGGAFDIFATDHCAFMRTDKDARKDDVRNIPNGIPGVGTLVPLMHELLCIKHGKTLDELRIRLSRNPAQLAGLYPRKGTIQVGADADLVLLAENGSPRTIRASLSDVWDPYAGRTTTLDVRHVFLRGREVVHNNRLTDADHPRGKALYVI
jgi:dihydropyrimidinase